MTMRSPKTFALLFVFQIFSASILANVVPTLADARVETVLGTQDILHNMNLPGFLPSISGDEILISRPQFVISYNKARRSANWVAWKVEANQLGSVQRSNNFSMDAELDNYLAQTNNFARAVSPSEYKGSCFDRGHQSPSGDHTNSVDDNRATFVMSNMIPQTPYLNRVVWEHLEEYTREVVTQESKTVYVISGPIYDKDFGAIGPNQDIPVPSKEFKVVMSINTSDLLAGRSNFSMVAAVIMPNILSDGTEPIHRTSLCEKFEPTTFAKDDWKRFQSTVSEIENLSGVRLH